MILRYWRAFALALTILLVLDIAVLTRGQEPLPPLDQVDFEVSYGEVRQAFLTGVLALHSFWYEEARDHFLRAQSLDPSFGMSYWGEAMTHDNALMTIQGADHERLGEEAVARMDELDATRRLRWSETEAGFAEAVRQRFHPGWDRDTRRQAYAEAMSELSARYPDEDEVTAFTALAIMALPGFNPENPAHVVSVASRLEEVYGRNREHPGVLHYLIHVYDTPTFARMGLRQARVYAGVAPASSHALHMPSHIFRHLGMWEEVAQSNDDAYQASVVWQERTGRPLHMRDFHALDWLLDAYLKLGRFEDAAQLIRELDRIQVQIETRGEEWGRFKEFAESMRAYYEQEAR